MDVDPGAGVLAGVGTTAVIHKGTMRTHTGLLIEPDPYRIFKIDTDTSIYKSGFFKKNKKNKKTIVMLDLFILCLDHIF